MFRAASAPPSLSPQSKALAARKRGKRRHRQDETANVNDTEKGQVPSSTFLSSSLSSRNNLKQEKSSGRSKPMSGLVVSVSGYSGPARAEVRKISTRLGALYNDSLDRHCAYLVCKKPEGRKYDKACEFPGTQIVTLEWLRACERAQKVVAPEDGVPHGKIFGIKEEAPLVENPQRKSYTFKEETKSEACGSKGVCRYHSRMLHDASKKIVASEVKMVGRCKLTGCSVMGTNTRLTLAPHSARRILISRRSRGNFLKAGVQATS